MKIFLSILLASLTLTTFSQKKILDHLDFDIWNVIKNPSISSDGNYIL